MSSFQPEVYAIDFGTSNSLLAAANRTGHHPPIPLDPLAEDPSLLRSVLFFPESRGPAGAAPTLGKSALDEYVAQGSRGRLVRSLKRFLPMKSFVRTQIGTRSYGLEELIAIVLRAMRERADRHFGARVTRAVLGRPARFAQDAEDDVFAEERLRQAARLAGFEEVAFCPEPVAAARDFRDELARESLLLVGDFGGGTSDYSLVMMGQGGFALSDVLAIGGVSVAGDALDGSLMRGRVARHFGAEVRYRVPFGDNVLTMPKPLMEKLCSPAEMSLLAQRDAQSFLNDVRSWSLGADDRRHIDQLFALVEDGLGFMLFEAIEHAKKALSSSHDTLLEFHVPGVDIDQPIRRDEFELGAQRELSAIIAALDTTLERAGARASDVELVCLTGGTARVPCIRSALAERFGEHRLHSLRGLHAVAEGLARHAHRLIVDGVF
ncbi:MAG TPA: Hsp70 family protein [Polyangiaceae bacterium]|nr:Hsp70 family protein [Polyangiaceae bacterium]